MAERFAEGFEIVHSDANGRVRTLGERNEDYPVIQDFAGFSATDVYTALTNALTTLATVYFPPGAYALNTDFTIASGKTVVLMPGAVLTVNSGKTLTCTGTCLRFVTGQIVATGTATGSGKLLITTTNA